MYWKSKGSWKKAKPAGHTNKPAPKKTDEIMQRPVKPSKGIGKDRPAPKEIVADPLKGDIAPKDIDPKPKKEIVEKPPVVEEIVEEPVEEIQEETPNYHSMTKRQLKELAESEGHTVSKKLSKQGIIDLLVG